MYHVLYNDSAGKKHFSQMTTYRIIHDKSTRAPILCLYNYVQSNQLQLPVRSHHAHLQTRMISHTKTFLHQPICQGIWFMSPFNVRRKKITNKPGHKIYRCMLVSSTRHHTLLHNPKILRTKSFFAPACHPRQKILSKTKLSQSSLLHPRSIHTSPSTSK